jgi:hypothetical protein
MARNRAPSRARARERFGVCTGDRATSLSNCPAVPGAPHPNGGLPPRPSRYSRNSQAEFIGSGDGRNPALRGRSEH